MGSFFLPFSFFLYGHVTSCIRDSLHFARRFAPSNCVRCGTSSILFSPTKRKHHVIRSVVLFLAFSLFLYGHITSCIRDSLHFVRRFAPSKCVRCGTSSILFSLTIMKSSTCFAPWDFLLPFPFFLYNHITSCIRDSLHFARRFAPSNDVRCGTSSILSSLTIMRSFTCSAPWDFLLPFPFSLICHSPCP